MINPLHANVKETLTFPSLYYCWVLCSCRQRRRPPCKFQVHLIFGNELYVLKINPFNAGNLTKLWAIYPWFQDPSLLTFSLRKLATSLFILNFSECSLAQYSTMQTASKAVCPSCWEVYTYDTLLYFYKEWVFLLRIIFHELGQISEIYSYHDVQYKLPHRQYTPIVRRCTPLIHFFTSMKNEYTSFGSYFMN